MADKLNPKTVSFSLAGVSAILSLACGILLMLAPDATLRIFGSIFHGLDISKIAVPVTVSGILTGTAAIAIVAFMTGWLFAIVYNNFSKKAR